MKLENGLMVLLLTGMLASGEAALAAVRKPISSHSPVISKTAASGRVQTLPASSLPKDAIVPAAKSVARTAPLAEARRSPEAVYVTTDPNQRWQLYSYP